MKDLIKLLDELDALHTLSEEGTVYAVQNRMELRKTLAQNWPRISKALRDGEEALASARAVMNLVKSKPKSHQAVRVVVQWLEKYGGGE